MYCFKFHLLIHFVYISTGFRYNSSSHELNLFSFFIFKSKAMSTYKF